ncbi:hypothetical protein OIO90_003906 [Microbotryomycetes sp. JL221]|nr:hypothetical protein OIO90_003906 [Microbotryomycetes sp. JL221]
MLDDKMQYALSTLALHADDGHTTSTGPVAPDISLSTTFRQPSPEELASDLNKDLSDNWDPYSPSRHIYKRETTPTLARLEKAMTAIIGQDTICYASGIAATFAILLHVQPDVIAITKGYPGAHGAIKVFQKTKKTVKIIELDDEYPHANQDQKLLVWLETPLNPTGEARSIAKYAEKAHGVGGVVAVDSTFGPPPVQDPFKWGADIVMHSATKYFAGHSDCLVGSVSVKSKEAWLDLWETRMFTGSNVGSLEVWLLLRSLRTLSVRVSRQMETATRIASFLDSLTKQSNESSVSDQGPLKVLDKVWHASLQSDAEELVGRGKQMETGPACFLIRFKQPEHATAFPHKLKLFAPAASLGGVESLVEQRIQADPSSDPCLVRLSIGLEDFDDLKRDLVNGLKAAAGVES